MSGQPEPLISVVIPVFNGANSIAKVVEACIEATAGHRLEIILVNDCSSDNSIEVCVGLHNSHKDVIRFYTLAKNVGEHNAVMAGLSRSTGDYMVIMDDDFQNPPSEILKLVRAAMDGGHDVVYTTYATMRMPLLRRLGSWFNDRVATFMLDKPRNLYLSSFKLLNRFLVDEVIKYKLPFPYLDGLILRVTDNISSVQVEHSARTAGQSGYTLRKLIRLWLNMFVNFSIMPLRVAGLMGLAFSVLGLVLGIWAAVERLLQPDLPLGWATLMVTISIFAGVQLSALGMIGEYIGRAFMSQNKKPQYTIRNAYE